MSIILIYFITGIILCLLGYNETRKVSLSDNSRINLFELFLPNLIKNEKIYYFLLNIICAIIFYFIEFKNNVFNYTTIIEIIKFNIIFQSSYMLAAIDLKSFKIPNKYTFPLIIGMLIFSILSPSTFLNSLLGLLAGFFAIFILQIINPNGIGGGDAKLCALLGILLGFPNIIYGILGGFVLGGCFALILLKAKILSRKDYIPYGIYFFVASIIVYFIF